MNEVVSKVLGAYHSKSTITKFQHFHRPNDSLDPFPHELALDQD